MITALFSGCSKGGADSQAPNLNIVSVNIPVDAVDVPVNATISFTFDSPMSKSCSNCIILKKWIHNSKSQAVPGITTTSNSVIEFTPQEELQPNTRYYVEVSAATNINSSKLIFSDYSYHSNSSFFFTTGGSLEKISQN
jgi:hypothetical protein